MTNPRPSRLPISAIVVIHNEEKLLERSLRSCADLVSEIIIIHDGPCNDRSLEIARKYTSHIFIQERIGEAEPHRVFGLKQCQNDWILFLDADEFLSDELREHLPKLLSNPACQAYDLAWPTWYKQRYYTAYSKRALFRKSCFYFIGAPHEYARPLNSTIRSCSLPYLLEHKPLYDNLTWKTFKRKWLPWTRIHAQYYLKPFSALEKYNCMVSGWEPATYYRIKYPIFLGIFGSFVAQLFFSLRHFVRHPHLVFLKSGLMMACYHVCVYYYVWKHKT